MSSLLGRSGALKRGSTSPDRRYLRIVFRDSPVRRAISRIECPSRRCQRRITLSNAMSITPKSPAINQQGWVQTWVTSQWKNPSIPGQLSAEINTKKIGRFFMARLDEADAVLPGAQRLRDAVDAVARQPENRVDLPIRFFDIDRRQRLKSR